MNKKGELTSEQLVSIIIVIITFAVLLLFLLVSNWNPTIDKQTCHESVVFRSTSNGLIETSNIVPLKCETEKICFSRGKECQIIGKNSKENPVNTIRLSADNKEAKEKIKETLANSMIECHSMLGEGQLNYMPRGWGSNNYCLICSRIGLDNNVLESLRKGEIEAISFAEMYQYLQEKKTPDGKSYLEYLHPGWTDWHRIQPVFEEYKLKSKSSEIKNMKLEDWKINLEFENGYVIISQMRKPGTWSSWAWGGVTALGIIATASGIGAPVGIGILGVAGASGGIVTWYTHPGGQYVYAPPELYPYEIKELQNIQCSSFETAP